MKKSTLFLALSVLCLLGCHKNDDNAPSVPSGPSAIVSTQLGKTDSLSTFTAFYKAASISDADVTGGVTIFAPSNSAFSSGSASAGPILPDSSVVKDYMVKGIVKPSDLTTNKTFTTLSGKTLTVTVVGDPIILVNGVIINDSAISTGNGYVIYGATQLLNAATPLFFTVWDHSTYAPGKLQGDPAAQATVNLYRNQQDYGTGVKPAYTSIADKDGVATVPGVLPGSYYVVATKGGASNVLSWYSQAQNGLYTGYYSDSIDASGNLVYDVNMDGVINQNDVVNLPAMTAKAAKHTTSNYTIYLDYYPSRYTTIDMIQGELNTVYKQFYSGYYNLLLADGMMAGNEACNTSSSLSINFCPFSSFTENPITPAIGTIWSNYYNMIQVTNIILRDVPLTTAPAAQQADVMGQARGLRAYAYMQLLAYYGSIPLAKDLVPTFFPGITQSTNTEVYDSIVNDLTAAAASLPTTRTDGKASLTKYAALGLLAKVSLWKGDYASAKNYTSQIINGGQYSLTPNDYSWLTNPNTTETIWAPVFSSYFITAYGSWFFNGQFPVTVSVVPVLRYADILLMDAEARMLASADYSGAAQDLNLLLARRGQSTSPSTNLPALHGAWYSEKFLQGEQFYNTVRWGGDSVYLPRGYKHGINNVIPIPQSALIQYIDIRQNAGY